MADARCDEVVRRSSGEFSHDQPGPPATTRERAAPMHSCILSGTFRRRVESVPEGTVIVIGGAEDKVRDRVILSRFVTLAGGPDAVVAVISTASSMGLEAGERYREVFGQLGVPTVRPIHAATRQQANDEATARSLGDATGIFLTGGNQLRLSSTLGGTHLADAIFERFEQGAVIAGTSAGASAMSSHMIAFGASGATPKLRMAQIAAGLGVLPGVIIDQHFQERNRLGRLLSLIAQNPSLLGLGVDEDTAGIVGPDHVMEVIGRGSITIIDGAASETDAWEIGGHRPLMISGVVLHSLPAGYHFDLRRRRRIATPQLRALAGGEAASS
jgi:cyanophycinase